MPRAKFFVALMLAAVMVIPAVAKKTKTAECKDNVLTDQRYNCTLNILKNWKVKTFKEKDEQPRLLRAMVIQKNYRINQEAKEFDADFTIPEIQLYVRPDTMSAESFMKNLEENVISHNSGDDIINQLNLLLSGEFVGMQEIELGGEPAFQAIFKRQWRRELQADEGDPKYRQYGGLMVRDVHDIHEVYALNHNGCLYVFQAFAENEFYPMVKEEFREIIASIKFEDVVSSQIEEPLGK